MASVLIVDDSAMDQRLAGVLTQQAGCDVRYAANGLEALKQVQLDRPHAVLTDLQMPQMDGLQLVKQLNRDYPGLPVILMTAEGSEERALHALHAGATSYVPKKNLRHGLGEALQAVFSAVAACQQHDQPAVVHEESPGRFMLGYEPDASQALISHLLDGLKRLEFSDESTLLRLAMALSAAIANAIEHGNLELSTAVRDADVDAYRQLADQRVRQPPYCDRRVRITARLTPSEARFVIRDEGPGFDPSTLPDPTDPENLVRPRGRGMMLLRTFLDEVLFNDRGKTRLH